MTKQIYYRVIAIITIMTMAGCNKEDDIGYSLYYTNYESLESYASYKSWRIDVISELFFHYHFESKKFSGDKTFFFTYNSRTDSITVRNIRPGEIVSIGVMVTADEGDYTVNEISVNGSILRYTVNYSSYYHSFILWTDDFIVKENESHP